MAGKARMTSKERLLTVLKRQMPDRVPISPRIWAWQRERYGTAGWEAISRMKAEGFDFDPLVATGMGMPDFLYTQRGDHRLLPDVSASLDERQLDGKLYIRRTIQTPAGSLTDEMVYPPAGPVYGIHPNPEKLEPLIKTADDLEKVRYLLPEPGVFVLTDVAAQEQMIGDEGLFELRVHNGVDHMMVDSFGIAGSMIMLHDDNELFRKALKLYHEYYKLLLRTGLERGAKVIYEGWYNFGMSAGWPPQVWREYFLPMMLENVQIAHAAGAYIHLYDDGKIMAVLDGLAETGWDIVSTLCPPPSGDADPIRVKQVLGPRSVLMGFVDLLTIRFGTAAEVDAEVRRAIEILGRDGGYILSTSDSIRDGSPFENVKAFFDAALKYGWYV